MLAHALPNPAPATPHTHTYPCLDAPVIDTPVITHNTPLVKPPHTAFLVDRKDLTWSLLNVLRIMPTPILLFPRLPSSHLFSWDVSPDWTSQALGPMHSYFINGL